jgi:hypothetical protein
MTDDERDDLLEEIACLIERPTFREIQGIAARRKADRQAVLHRNEGWGEARKVFATNIRLMKGRQDTDIGTMLAEAINDQRLFSWRDYGRIWPLIQEGLAEVVAEVPLSGNTDPAQAKLSIRATMRGEVLLETVRARIMRAAP